MSLQSAFSLKTHKSRVIVSGSLLAILVPIALIGAINFGLFSSATSSPNVAFSSPVNLSDDTYQAQYPWVVTSGSYVFVAWTEEAHGIYFRMSSNYGETWTPALTGPATRLSETGGTTSYPVMAINGSNVYVAWTQSLTSGGNGEIFVASSNNYGASFSTEEVSVNLTAYTSDIPYLAAYGNDVYVIWHAVATSNAYESVWVSSSGSAGQKWTTAYELDEKTGQADEPQITAWGAYAYATWDRNGPYVSYTSNNGLTWSNPVNLNPGTKAVPAGTTREPWITAAGSNVYVTWNDNSGYGTSLGKVYDPYIMVSNDNGLKWNVNNGGVKLNLMPNSSSSWEIQDQAVGNTVYVIWRDHTPNYTVNGDILMMISTNAGATWTPSLDSSIPMDVSNDNQITGWSNGIGVSGSTVALAYMSDCITGEQEPSPDSGPGDCGMMVSYSNNGGSSFFPEVNISNDRTAGPITDVSSSNFAVSGTNVYAVWQDQAASNFQVYFSMTNGNIVQPTSYSITPVRGAVGTVVNVTGNNFAPSSAITVQFDGSTLPTTPASAITNSTGGFDVEITIPGVVAGSQTISATVGTQSSSKNFNVVPNISLSPVRGPGGTSITVTGNGFASDSQVTVTFGTSGQVALATTDNVGNFTATFDAPVISAGTDLVTATDSSANSATANFNLISKITLSPVKGSTATTLTVTGTGFFASAPISVDFNGVPQTTSPVSVESNANGSFSASFTVPSSPAGSTTVSASDGTNSATASYNVVPSVSITPKTSAGKNTITVTVTGTGFAANSQITITFGGVVQTTNPTTVTTDGTGSFSATFMVPNTTPAAKYAVQATDASGNSDPSPPNFTVN